MLNSASAALASQEEEEGLPGWCIVSGTPSKDVVRMAAAVAAAANILNAEAAEVVDAGMEDGMGGAGACVRC